MFYSTIASWPVIIYKTLQAEDIDPKPIFKQAGIDPALMDKQGQRYKFEDMTRLWADASDASNHQCFGLEAGKKWHPTTFHALGIAWLSSKTLEVAFTRLVRHIAMVSTAVQAEFIYAHEHYVFKLKPQQTSLNPHPQGIVAGLVSTLTMCRQSVGNSLCPVEVNLTITQDSCKDAHENFFDCPVHFDQPYSGLGFSTKDIKTPLLSANLELLKSSEKIIADYLQRIGKNDLLADVRVQMMQQLPSGEMTDDSIANALHMSTRTLQRRLKEFGLTYRELLEKVRLELAEQYLNDPNYSITEISFLLGFSETSSFSKSYKKMTGQSPSESRQ